MQSKIGAVAAAACLLVAAALPVQAAGVLLDRGLPTANVNEDLVNPPNGANRSNVNWYDGRYTSSTDYWLLGDTLTNTSGQTWHITTLRMWTVEPMTAGTAQLYGKVGAAAYAALSTGSAITPGVKYANGDTYRDAFGSNTTLYQVDFTVDIQLAAGQTLSYLFDASWNAFDGPPGLHASNAALSGSPQQGADDLMLAGRLLNGSIEAASVAPWTSAGNGWDKASDFNVLAIGDVVVVAADVPEPASLALAGVALLTLAGLRRQRTV